MSQKISSTFCVGTLVLLVGLFCIVVLFSTGAVSKGGLGYVDPHQLKTRFIYNVVPAEISIPPIRELDELYPVYKEFVTSYQESLSVLFEEDKNYSPYKIKKMSSSPSIYVGYPAYLTPYFYSIENSKVNNQEIEKIVSSYFSIFEDIQITQDKKNANIFLMPVSSKTYIEIEVPDVHKEKKEGYKYQGIFSSLDRVLGTHNKYNLNSYGLKGSFLTSDKNEIIVSFCPIDTERNIEEIKENVFYCIVQSQGLPRFFENNKKMSDESQRWAVRLLSKLKCKEIKAGQSIFDVDLSNECREENR